MEQHNTISWEGRDIRLSYIPGEFGGVIDHLEIRSDDGEPLPITNSGYRSHFFGSVKPSKDIDEIATFVLDWLNKEAQSKKWKSYIEQSRQLSLFCGAVYCVHDSATIKLNYLRLLLNAFVFGVRIGTIGSCT